MTITVYHNPRCSKSRQTLALLREHDVEPDIVDYLRDPPDAAQLSRLLDLLGLEPRQLMRSAEAAYRENALDDDTLGRDQLIAAMVSNPILIQRPIVVRGERARIGRPPENVLDILPSD